MSNLTKSYKGYQGAVAFDDGALIVTVLHIRDFVSDECSDASQVQTVFESLVDQYLEDCQAVGKSPDRPYSGTFNVRIDPDLHRRAVHAAAMRKCSLNDYVGRAIQKLVLTDEQPHEAEAWANIGHGAAVYQIIEYLQSKSEHRFEERTIGSDLSISTRIRPEQVEAYTSRYTDLGRYSEWTGLVRGERIGRRQ